ncbi:hypothetical protein ACHAWF_010678 [Thalassiosira exigua]
MSGGTTAPKRAAAPLAALLPERDDGRRDSDREARPYTRVEDGSPLGVAVVALGSLVVLGGDDESWREPTSASAWIVFAAASVTAGLARLTRYLRDKNKNE